MKPWMITSGISLAGAAAMLKVDQGLQPLLIILLSCIAIEFITGNIDKAVQSKLSAREIFKGLAKKVAILSIVLVAYYVDVLLGSKNIVRDGTIFFYLFNEMMSILNNANSIGLPIPDFLKKAVEFIKNNKNQKK